MLPHSKNTVLLVDDDADFRQYVAVMLKHLSLNFLHASDGMEALSYCHAQKPGLIFTDINMPVLDGYDFIIKLREVDMAIPIIAMSSEEGGLQKALVCGANAILEKSFSQDDISNCVKKYLLS